MKYPSATSDFTSARRGRIGILLAFVLMMTILLGILVINSFFVGEIRVQQDNACDAAALAAAQVLAREALLYGDPSIFTVDGCPAPAPCADSQNGCGTVPDPTKPLFCQALQSGIDFAGKNYVSGKSFRIQPSDVVFDIVDIPERSVKGSMPADPTVPFFGTPIRTLAEKRKINAVRVESRSDSSRSNAMRLPILKSMGWHVRTSSMAVLDGNIYGFHTDPEGAINIPMAPIALYAENWSEQVERPVDRTFVSPSDGPLPFGDFKIAISAAPLHRHRHDPGAYSPILLIGVSKLADAVAQMNADRPGITPAQYAAFRAANNDQPFALDTKASPFQMSIPAAPMTNSSALELATLEANLQALKKNETRLIWPLFSSHRKTKQGPTVTITGFVAARVTNVKRVSREHHHGKSKGPKDEPDAKNKRRLGEKEPDDEDAGHTVLELTLHPTLLATSTGMVFVKDWPTGDHQYRFPNAYVKRVRLMK